MYDIKKKYKEWVNANKKISYEIENLKIQIWKVKKELAFMKLDSY